MKHTSKKIICTLLSAIICFSSLFVTSYATENEKVTDNVNLHEFVNATDLNSKSSVTLLSEGGILSTSKSFTINVPETTTYTFTLVANPIEGSNTLWTTLAKAGEFPKIDRAVSGTFQQRLPLTKGTWYLQLTAAPGTFAYSVSIHRTF